MTSPAPVDVKGQGRARGRRRPGADGPTKDASGFPDNRPDAHDHDAAPEAVATGAPEPGGVAEGPPEGDEAPPTDSEPTGRWDVLADEEADPERSAIAAPEELPPPHPTPVVDSGGDARTTARRRRAQEHADQAAEIEAAALAESPRAESPRDVRRRRKRAVSAAAGIEIERQESRRERRARNKADGAAEREAGTRRGRKARKRDAGTGDPAGPAEEPVIDLRPGPVGLPRATGTDGGDHVGEPAAARRGPTVAGALTAAAAAAAATDEAEPVARPTPPAPAPAVESAEESKAGLAAAVGAGDREDSAAPDDPDSPEDDKPGFVPRPMPVAGRDTTRDPRPSGTQSVPSGQRPSRKHVPRAVVLRQRRRRRHTIIGTTVLLTVVNLLLGSTYAYFQWRLDEINRVPVPGLNEDVQGEVMNVLLVGSDSRDRLTGQDAAQAGKDEVDGQRSDTIMVLHVDPRQQRAAILAIPRDLYVPISGTAGSDRVNAAFATGGAERLIATLAGLGIEVNHYAEVDFVGFKEIVDAIGGVDVFLPNWVRDFSSGLDVPRSGCVELDGSEALAYVRSRQFESLVDGTWVTDPRADLGRIERQQDFIRRVMKKGVSAGISNPVALNRLIGIGVRNLTIDDTMSTSDITDVARRFRSVDPESVETLVLPTTPQTIDGKAVLVLKDQEAQDEIAKINGAAPLSSPTTLPGATTPTTPDQAGPLKPADIRIQVLNGNGTKGVAKGTADALKAAGFDVVSTGDTPTVARTLVRYASGQEAKARFIAGGLQAGGQVQADARLTSADIALVLGTDYKGFGDPNATPTTVAGAAPAPVATTPPKPAC